MSAYDIWASTAHATEPYDGDDPTLDETDEERAERIADAIVPPRRGGARPGAGRKPAGRIKRDVSLPPEVWALVEDYRQREGITTTGEAVEALLRLAAPPASARGPATAPVPPRAR